MAATAAKTVAKKVDNVLFDIAEAQLDASTAVVKSAIDTFEKQIDQAREIGSAKGKKIAEGFGFDNKIGDMMTDMAGYMGEAAGAGLTMGFAPMMLMAGTAKASYKYITD